jgi:hypothetical protein
MMKKKHVARTARMRSPQKVIVVELERKRYLKRWEKQTVILWSELI